MRPLTCPADSVPQVETYGKEQGFTANSNTRFAVKHLQSRDLLRSMLALKKVVKDDDWEDWAEFCTNKKMVKFAVSGEAGACRGRRRQGVGQAGAGGGRRRQAGAGGGRRGQGGGRAEASGVRRLAAAVGGGRRG
jgi:hypothetical protein